jgi:hypothetical protein
MQRRRLKVQKNIEAETQGNSIKFEIPLYPSPLLLANAELQRGIIFLLILMKWHNDEDNKQIKELITLEVLQLAHNVMV